MEKILKPKKNPIYIYLTSLSQRELKKIFPGNDKIMYIDVNKIILESFNTDKELNDIQYWILNQTLVKKIGGVKDTKIEKIYLILKQINKTSLKSLKDLLKENDIKSFRIELYTNDLPA